MNKEFQRRSQVPRAAWRVLTAALVLASSAFAQPVITAVIDGGAYTDDIPQGAVFVVKGTGLSGSGYVAATAPDYPTLLNQVSISCTPINGGDAVPALMVYTYNINGVNQLAAVMPSTAPLGDYNVRVMNMGVQSAAFQATVVARKPGIVTSNGGGTGPAQATITGGFILQRFANVGKIGVFDTRPIKPGERVDLWGTGLGADVASDTGGSSGDQTEAGAIRVLVNGVEIVPLYAGRSEGYPGLDQIVFIMPSDVALSCFTSLQVRAQSRYSNAVTVATANGEECSTPGLTQQQLRTLSRGEMLTVGAFTVASAHLMIPGGNFGGFVVPDQNVYSESIDGAFHKVGAALGRMSSFSGGSDGMGPGCIVYRQVGDVQAFLGRPTAASLDAGTVTATLPDNSNAVLEMVNNAYHKAFTTGLAPTQTLGPGDYSLSGLGGADIGAFSAAMTLPSFTWTNGSEILAVDRSQDLTIEWTGGGTGFAVIVGVAGKSVSGTLSEGDAIVDAAVFSCTTRAAAGTFTIPSAVLQQLPVATFNVTATSSGEPFEMGALGVFAVSDAQTGTFTAPLVAGGDIDFGQFGYDIGELKLLSYQ